MPYELVISQDRLGEVANAVDRAEAVSFDIETTSLCPWDGEIRLFSIKTADRHFVVDLFKTGHPEAVVRALTDPKSKTVKVIQNAKFEQRWFLHKYGNAGEMWPIFDPFRASNLIYNGRDLTHDLFAIQERELQVKPGEDLAKSGWGGELTPRQLQYSADDTEYLLPLRETLKATLTKYGLNKAALIEFGAVLPESSIENNGFYLDRERWLALYEQNRITAKQLRRELQAELPHPRGQLALPGIEDGGGFNIGSTQQLQKSLAKLGVNVTSTNKDVLGLLIPKIRDKAVRATLVKLIEYKKVKKLCESFGPDFLDDIDRKTGRIHSSFYPYTGAGRYSCSAPWTPVRTSVGLKPLGSVVPGDFVWTHKQRWRRVLAFLPQGNRAVFDVRFSDGQVLTCTDSHRVLLSDGRWGTVEEIQRFEQSRTPHSRGPQGPALYVGEGQPVRTIEAIYPRGSLEVYDLTVEEDESFETCGIFSHNCSNPNLQQIPRLKTFRDCFRASDGMALGVWDYSQIELRIAADISGDARMIRAYSEGLDLHILTAALLNEIPIEEVTKAMRQPAKAGNFGLLYGMGAEKLAAYAQTNYGVAMSEDEAFEFRTKFFQGYQGLKRWHRRVFSEESKRKGYTRTLSGRIRYLASDKHSEFANCVDFETEALTQRGWVRGFDLTLEDTLLTKNAVSGALEWQRPTELCLFPDYEGPVVEFRSRSFHAVSTPDHRWLVRDKSSGQDVERTTRTLSPWGDHRIHRTGDYRPVFESALTGDEAELLGWFVTDGYVARGQKRNGKSYPFKSVQAFLTQSLTAKPDNCVRIDALVARLGGCTGRYEKRTQAGNGVQVVWNLGRALSKLLVGRCPERTLVVQSLLDLDRTALDRLRESMLLGDGTSDVATGKRVFCTGRKDQAEAFQALCTLTGVAASLVWRDMRHYAPVSSKLVNVPKMTGCWLVTLLQRSTVQVVHDQRREIVVKCPVWCPVVPNTFFVARRSGQVFVTGNTPVQGTGADGLKASLRLVYMVLKPHGGKVRMVNMVHDEIVSEASEADAELRKQVDLDVNRCMVEGMQQFLPTVPVVVDGGWGASWADK